MCGTFNLSRHALQSRVSRAKNALSMNSGAIFDFPTKSVGAPDKLKNNPYALDFQATTC